MAEQEYPESFYCALTQAVMDDPYIDPEGNTYEKTAIFKWLEQKETSPITRAPLKKTDLVPNRALQDAIRAALKEGPVRAPPEVLEEAGAGEAQPTLRVITSADKTLVSIVPDVGLSRSPVDLVAVIDVSGSMQTEATMMNEKGGQEAHGLTLLDIVKHATRTLINTLGAGDRLGIVSFSTQAKEVLALTVMDKKGKEAAEKALELLQPDASTNIWDGLRLGMDTLRAGNRDEVGRLQSCFLLTDGCPNVEPPRGHIPMLERYLDKHPELKLQLCTFGFGYNLDSKLLDDLARVGGGRYGFIPDATFVGTAFVHAAANTLCGFVKGAKVTLAPSGQVIPVASLCYGQTSDYVVQGEVQGATLQYQTRQGNTVSLECAAVTTESDMEVEVQSLRVEFCKALQQALDNAKQLDHSQAIIHALVERIRGSAAAGDRRIKKLLEDAEGQVTEAFSRQDWFSKWGQHYIPSLLCAHKLQEANNFKDPGVQVYGGKLFGQLRDDADDVFNSLPPPKPSINKNIDMYGRPVGGAAPRPAVRMAAYNNSRNVCFAGGCRASMADGTTKQVSQIAPGDVVASGATVICVVQSEASALVRVDRLLVTPWHPISTDGGRTWQFPADVGQPALQSAPVPVFSFVLDSVHLMTIEGVLAVSLGHHFKGDIREHAFWGSRRVIDALRALPGYHSKGRLSISSRQVIRDSGGVVDIVADSRE